MACPSVATKRSSPGVVGTDSTSTRDRLLRATLSLIDASGGLRGVNLRRICSEAGCAHTNAYNYFATFEELLWSSLALAMTELVEHTTRELQRAPDGEHAFDLFIGSQMDFALAHPGWYRFIWLEQLEPPPPPSVVSRMRETQALFAVSLARTLGCSLPEDQASDIADLVHTYLHGEICKTISGRRLEPDPARDKGFLITRCRRLFELASTDSTSLSSPFGATCQEVSDDRPLPGSGPGADRVRDVQRKRR